MLTSIFRLFYWVSVSILFILGSSMIIYAMIHGFPFFAVDDSIHTIGKIGFGFLITAMIEIVIGTKIGPAFIENQKGEERNGKT